MFINWHKIKDFLFTFSKLQALRFYLIYFLSYLMMNMVPPISQKNVKFNSPGLALAIDPTSP